MNKELFIVCVETCKACQGAGYVPAHAEEYREFNKASQSETIRLLSVLPGDENYRARNKALTEFGERWWAEHGYPGGVMNWPQEEDLCIFCGGCGKVERRMPLKKVIKKIAEKEEI
jgi:hypothetical protein